MLVGTVPKSELPEDGYIVLPKTVSIAAAASLMVWLVGVTWFGASEFTVLKERFAHLERNDVAQDVMATTRARLADERYEAGRVRDGQIIRLEEQQKVTNELLREIRSQLAQERARVPVGGPRGAIPRDPT